MKTCRHIAFVAGIMMLTHATALIADDATATNTPMKHQARHAFLGIAVDSIHPALSSNLRDLLSSEQGLIVEDLTENSPAAKAGIKVHDILTTYDDQKLFSAEQLAKLVHSDRPGREVKIGILRDGKLETVQATLGDADAPRARAWTGPRTMPNRPDGLGRMLRRFRSNEPASAPEWENFDSLTLKKLGDNKFQAEVVYLDKEGKTRKHVFQGTREEIRKSIDAEKDLKPAERTHLLRSLNLWNLEDDTAAGFWFGPGIGRFADELSPSF